MAEAEEVDEAALLPPRAEAQLVETAAVANQGVLDDRGLEPVMCH